MQQNSMASLLLDIKAIVMRGQFLATLAMFFSITLMVIQNDINIRAILLLPVIVFYYTSKILFAKAQQELADKIIKKARAEQK
jgi:hypothetical protein